MIENIEMGDNDKYIFVLYFEPLHINIFIPFELRI